MPQARAHNRQPYSRATGFETVLHTLLYLLFLTIIIVVLFLENLFFLFLLFCKPDPTSHLGDIVTEQPTSTEATLYVTISNTANVFTMAS
jgi:hypothetical protein